MITPETVLHKPPGFEVLQALLRGIRRKGGEYGRGFRVPIFLKFASLSAFLIFLVASCLSLLVLGKQKTQFMEQLITLGTAMTRIISSNAPDKLLNEEQVSLFQLVLDVASDDQVIDAVITDQDHVIVAHNRLEDISRTYRAPKDLTPIRVDGDFSVSFYTHLGQDILYFQKPILFQNVAIGAVYLTLSQKRIHQNLKSAQVHILLLTLLIVILSVPLSLGFSIYFSRPIKDLKESAQALGQGEFHRRVTINRNDTLGDLGLAFNKMAVDLAMKDKIKDSFGRYVTPEIVDLVLADSGARRVRSSRQTATVLFADIRGYTALAEEKDPEWLVEMLNDHFSRITDIVVRNGGHLNKFLGDGAMAVFGVPLPCEDHAARGVRTALEIQKACAQVRASGPEDVTVQVGIGISTGFVVAGNVGSEKKVEYTIIGDEVNVASRLTSLAEAGEILITNGTFEQIRIEEGLRAERRGAVQVKGKKNRVTVFRVVDLAACNEQEAGAANA